MIAPGRGWNAGAPGWRVARRWLEVNDVLRPGTGDRGTGNGQRWAAYCPRNCAGRTDVAGRRANKVRVHRCIVLWNNNLAELHRSGMSHATEGAGGAGLEGCSPTTRITPWRKGPARDRLEVSRALLSSTQVPGHGVHGLPSERRVSGSGTLSCHLQDAIVPFSSRVPVPAGWKQLRASVKPCGVIRRCPG